jgi:hypothetical protein
MKDAYWFRHDSNATTDPKMMALLRAHGWEGYGLFWRIVELMRDTEGYKIERARIADMAFSARADNLLEITETCCSAGLFCCDDTHIWSNRLCRDMEGRDAQREAGKLAAATRWGANSKLMASYRQANTMTGQDKTGQDKTEKEKTIPHVRSGLFDEFWTSYPRRVGKEAARRKYDAIIKRGVEHSAIIAGVARYVTKIKLDGTETQYIAHPATWLNQGRWQDEEISAKHDGYKPLVIPEDFRV